MARCRAEAHRARHGHGRADAELPGLVARGGDDAAPFRVSAHGHGPAAQRGIVALLDGRVERVHVEVEDAARGESHGLPRGDELPGRRARAAPPLSLRPASGRARTRDRSRARRTFRRGAGARRRTSRRRRSRRFRRTAPRSSGGRPGRRGRRGPPPRRRPAALARRIWCARATAAVMAKSSAPTSTARKRIAWRFSSFGPFAAMRWKSVRASFRDVRSRKRTCVAREPYAPKRGQRPQPSQREGYQPA